MPLYRGLKFIPKIHSQFDMTQKSMIQVHTEMRPVAKNIVTAPAKSITKSERPITKPNPVKPAQIKPEQKRIINSKQSQVKPPFATSAQPKIQPSKIEVKKPEVKIGLMRSKAMSMHNIASLAKQNNNKAPKSSVLPSSKPVTSATGLLYTELRALQRQQFEINRKDKELVGNAVKENEINKAKELHEAQMKKMKQDLTVAAQTKIIRNYKPIQIKPSLKPLTQPKTPNFAKIKKSASLHHINQ
jgi:hypothetical protein